MQEREFAGQKVLITGAGGGLGRALVAIFKARGANRHRLRSVGRRYGGSTSATSATSLRSARSRSGGEGCGATSSAARRAGHRRSTMPAGRAPKRWLARHRQRSSGSRPQSHRRHGLHQCRSWRRWSTRGSGAVVFISSVNALSHFGNPAYAAAKAGINAYARAIAVEYGRHGIRANAVCPGSIRTPAWDHRIAARRRHPRQAAAALSACTHRRNQRGGGGGCAFWPRHARLASPASRCRSMPG